MCRYFNYGLAKRWNLEKKGFVRCIALRLQLNNANLLDVFLL